MNQIQQLQIPEKLIGRESCKERMLNAFAEICSGRTRTLLIPGHSGMGKTSLVQWLKEPVQSRNGVFVQGKFDQYHQGTPYFAVRKALTKLWHCIESFNEVTRRRVRDRVHESLGDLGVLLIELIPDISSIFDKYKAPQARDNDIGFPEARHRFATVIRKFLEAVSLPEHPVVMFIDDWQWADAASMDLIKGFQAEASLRYFLLAAAYRDEAVDRFHPMTSVIAELHQQAVPPGVIEVSPLNRGDIETFVANALAAPVDEIDGLIDLIRRQTRGNPFYIRAFLEYAYERNLIRFDADSRRWEWVIIGELPDGIVDLFVRKLREFKKENREFISLAACLGNLFDVKSLCTIGNWPVDDCRALLASFRDTGLVLPADMGRGAAETEQADPSAPQWFRFMHDQVQQAAFSLISPDKLGHIRLKIGRLLLSRLEKEEIEERLFEILGHLNAVSELIRDTDEQKKMIELNMAASRKARSATAFRAMLGFNRAAYYFAGEMAGGISNFWDISYDQALALHRDLAESEFLEGDREKAEQCIQQSLPYTRTAIERAESLNILIVHYTLLARYDDAISSGRKALAEFGIVLPDDDFERFRDDEIRQIKSTLRNRRIADLVNQPPMQDPEMLIVTKLLITLGPPCYRTHQRLWSVLVPKVVNITLDFGLVPQIAYSHTAFGGLLGWIENDYQTAGAFGDAAEQIMTTKFKSPSDQSVFYLMIGSSIRHWFRHLKYASRDYLNAYNIGLQSGNMQYAAYAFGHNMYCRFYQGIPLPELIRETEQSLGFSRSRLNHWGIDLCEGGIRIFEMILGKDHPADMPSTEEAGFLDRVAGHKNIQVLCIYHVLNAFFHMVSNNHKEALLQSDKAEQFIYTVGTQGLLPWPEHVFTRFLIISALFTDADDDKRPRWQAELNRILAQLQIWADQCPENYSHKYLLAKAELYRIKKTYTAAAIFYDRAIDEAGQNRFIQWEGIANERACRFWQERQSGNLAQIYWQQAFNCYQVWGAGSKLTRMKNEFRDNIMSWFGHAEQGIAVNGDRSENYRKQFSEKHVGLLEHQAREKLSARQYAMISKQADELSLALERLRTETAERKKAELKLKENEKRFRKAEKLGKVGNWEYNLQTNGFWASDEVKRIYGFDPEGKHFTKESMESRIRDRGRARQALADLVEKNKPYDLECEIRPAGGDEKRIIRSTARLQTDCSGRPAKIAGVIQDITQRKNEEAEKQQLELKLLQAQKIKAIGTLAGGIAHDFNNILQPIIGFTEISIQDLPEDHPVQENLRLILQGSKRAVSLIKQILSFSRRRDADYKPLALQPIIEETLKLLRSIIPSNIDIQQDFPGENIYIFAKAVEVHEVVMNICTNAYHAMEQGGGVLRLSLAEHHPGPELKLDDKSRYCRLDISDTGTGIPADIIDHIYDPYFTTKDQGKGSGLGLSVVHGIVKSYKGTLHVDSSPEKGTRVSVYLPVIPEPEPVDSQVPDQPDSSGSEKILLVDDEPAIVTLGVRILERMGYTVTGKTGSVEALEAFKSDPDGFDLVITDMTMPVLLGTDLAQKIIDIRPDIPILICTGYSERVDSKTAEKFGVSGYINKPILQEELISKVRELLDRFKGK